jgi:hypothetical protein
MKYLYQDSRTAKHLRDWAGNADLIISTFYFWYAGTQLQTSQEGLLRSILFSILSQRRELVPVLFPDVCRALLSGSHFGQLTLSFAEIKAVFLTLTASIPKNLKIFLLIDGVDEYTGDHNELCDLLLHVSSCRSLKLLVSSRPIPACVFRFNHLPQLHLQDLTRNDIRQYVTDELGSHLLLRKMELFERRITTRIVDSVTNLACGVFLWVVLVVKNLNIGLQNYYSAEDLLEEIEKLPRDLEKLYDHMLGGIGDRSKPLASKYLQLVLRSTEFKQSCPMTLLQLSFAEDDYYLRALEAPIHSLSSEELDWRCEATEGRLRSRCCGLIEVHKSLTGEPYGRGGYAVRFLHRTVSEFLQAEGVWSRLIFLTSQTDFDVELALMSSSILEMKALSASAWAQPSTSSLRSVQCLVRMLGYEKHLIKANKKAYHLQYIPEMMKTIDHYWHDPLLPGSKPYDFIAAKASKENFEEKLPRLFPCSIIFPISVRALDPKTLDLLATETEFDSEFRNCLPAFLLIYFHEESDPLFRVAIARTIRATINRPNQTIALNGEIDRLWGGRWTTAIPNNLKGWSAWEYIMHHCFSTLRRSDGGQAFSDILSVKGHLEVISAMIANNADPNALIRSGTVSKEVRELSATFVVLYFLKKTWGLAEKVECSERDEICNLCCSIEQSIKNSGGSELDDRISYLFDLVSRPKRASRWSMERRKDCNTSPSKETNAEISSRRSSRNKFRREPWNRPRLDSQGSKVSPWSEYKLFRENQQSEKSVSVRDRPNNRVETDFRRQRQWQLTDRPRRSELLTTQERKLVEDLSKPKQAHKENRRCLEILSTLPFDRQREIFECIEIMKSTKSETDSSKKLADAAE